MSWRSLGRFARSVTLTAGAMLGVICIVWTASMAISGVKPLVFQSGSMSPAIETGDLAFARAVPADELEVGDIVSVIDDSDTRVTHRIVTVTPQGDQVRLQLQGDANNSPDAHAYTVAEADKVVGHIPGAGYLLTAAASPMAMTFGGLLLAACLVLGFVGRSDGGRGQRPQTFDQGLDLERRDSRLTTGTAVGMAFVVGIGGGVVPIAPTLAYYSDTPKVSSPVNGVDSAPWFTCEQVNSSAAYGTQPYLHYSFDEDSGPAQSGPNDPYFADSAGGNGGIYYQGQQNSGVTPPTGFSVGCARDADSNSVSMPHYGVNRAYARYVRSRNDQNDDNGPAGARWNTFSVNIWFKSNVTAGNDVAGVVTAFSNAGSYGEQITDRVIYLDQFGAVTFMVESNGTNRYRYTTDGYDYSDNSWHMATATLGSAGMCLYVDGELVGTCNAGVTTAMQTEENMWWRFGFCNLPGGFRNMVNDNHGHDQFRGYLDEAAIWTRQLSADEVSDMYRAALPIQA